MPVYEYECGNCGKRFEVTQKFSDPALTKCILCQGKNIRKVLSTPAFVLKGSGWYVTDYASEDRKKAAQSENPQPTETKPKTDCKPGACGTDSCPAKADS
ncbi:MAG: FmdB family zinc ribbon protein [Nitrospirota bacterium]